MVHILCTVTKHCAPCNVQHLPSETDSTTATARIINLGYGIPRAPLRHQPIIGYNANDVIRKRPMNNEACRWLKNRSKHFLRSFVFDHVWQIPYLCVCHVIWCRWKSFCYYWLGYKESRWRYRRRIFEIRIAVSCPCRIQLRPSVLLVTESSTMSQGKRILCKAARPIVGTTSPPTQYTPLDIRRGKETGMWNWLVAWFWLQG
jgi:hypothetical protein